MSIYHVGLLVDPLFSLRSKLFRAKRAKEFRFAMLVFNVLGKAVGTGKLGIAQLAANIFNAFVNSTHVNP